MGMHDVGMQGAAIEVPCGQSQLVLTAHPLQRMGAFAIAALARRPHPEHVGTEDFVRVVNRMLGDLVTTSRVRKGDAGWYLFGVSYILWPNCALHYGSRRTPEGLAAWRNPLPKSQWPGVPCMLCGRDAVGWYGKGDIPLGASIEHRNTRAPGHQGTPLCFPCVSSFHALPYACNAGGGVLSGIHSLNDGFLAHATHAALQGNLRAMSHRGDLKRGGGTFAVELFALQALRRWDKPLTSGLQTIHLSNNNQDQKFQVENMNQPLAEWLRSTASSAERRTGFRYLALSQATAKTEGLRMLAWRAFHQPEAIPSRALGWLRDQIEQSGAIPAALPELAPLLRSYLTEVLHVLDKDVVHVTTVAARIAEVVRDEKRLGDFTVATRQPRDLKAWLRKEIADWAGKSTGNEPFITVAQWRTLFDSGNTSWAARELLYVATFEELSKLGATVAVAEELDDEDFRLFDADG